MSNLIVQAYNKLRRIKQSTFDIQTDKSDHLLVRYNSATGQLYLYEAIYSLLKQTKVQHIITEFRLIWFEVLSCLLGVQ